VSIAVVATITRGRVGVSGRGVDCAVELFSILGSRLVYSREKVLDIFSQESDSCKWFVMRRSP